MICILFFLISLLQVERVFFRLVWGLLVCDWQRFRQLVCRCCSECFRVCLIQVVERFLWLLFMFILILLVIIMWLCLLVCFSYLLMRVFDLLFWCLGIQCEQMLVVLMQFRLVLSRVFSSLKEVFLLVVQLKMLLLNISVGIFRLELLSLCVVMCYFF